MKRKLLYLLAFFVISVNVLLGQGNIDGNPVTVKWMQINTDTLRLIFPDFMNLKAQEVSNYIHHLAKNNSDSLGSDIRKINIVLQSNTSEPGGYVGMAPFKSEINSLDVLDVEHNNLKDVLPLQEYIHSLHYLNTSTGFANILYLVHGVNGWSLTTNLSIPSWFFEGDVLLNDAFLVKGSRGRISPFQQIDNANLYANKYIKYKHIRMGSFKTQVPNQFEYGFALSSYLKGLYENDIWANELSNTMSMRCAFFPFSNSLRMHTYLSVSKLYEKAYAHYQKEFNEKLSKIKIVEGEKVSKDSKDVTNYSFPSFYKGELYVLKSSYSSISEIVKIDASGNEKHVCYPSNTTNYGFSIANNKIVWSEYSPHPRWKNVNYSDIVIFDLSSGKKTKLTNNEKFFSPALSNDASKIVAVEYTKEQNCQLVIIDSKNGNIIKKLSNKDNDYLMYPKWSNENEIICSSSLDSVCSIYSFDIKSDSESLVIGPFNNVITDLVKSADRYYFSASFSGIDNIYEYNTVTKQINQMSSVPVGAYWPAVSEDSKNIVFASAKEKGMELRQLSFDKLVVKQFNPKALDNTDVYSDKSGKMNDHSIVDLAINRNDSITEYSKFCYLANVHTWGIKASNTMLGLSLKSDNILNTLGATAEYTYNRNERSNAINANIIYGGFWIKTIFDFSLTTGRDFGFVKKDSIGDVNESLEKIASLKFVLPLDFSSGLYKRSLSLSAGLAYNDMQFDKRYYSPTYNSFLGYNLALNFGNIRSYALKNIAPRWGQTFSVLYSKSFNSNRAEELSSSLRFYLPSFFKNHNLELAAEYKWKGTDYSFIDNFNYSRAYNLPVYKKIINFMADYNLPVAYPEFGINGVFYTNRLAAKIFADYSITDFDDSFLKREYSSVGLECFFDVLFFHVVKAKIGCRESYLLNKDFNSWRSNDYRTEIVFRMNV